MSEPALPSRDWEAAVYHRVSQPHSSWVRAILDRVGLEGGEVVLDAGCGTGKLAAALMERLPNGRVIAVDASPAMIEEARHQLPSSVALYVQDLTDLELPEQVDVVLSSATFHWISDHERLFARLAAALRPGGRLEAQCGGTGNVSLVVDAIDRLRCREPWRAAFGDWAGPWNFAGPSETEARLRRFGFNEARCWLEPDDVLPDDPATFLRTVVLGAHLERLPGVVHDAFVADVCEEMARADRGRGGRGDIRLDYVRLNISAVRSSKPTARRDSR